MENIEQIIHKSKVLADRVRAALLLQNNLALDGFDITDVEFSKPLAQLEDKKATSEKTLHGIQVKLSEAKINVDEISRAYHASVEEHASLGNMKNDLLKHSEVKKLEMSRVQLETQNKLKTFKAITGTHFNFNPFEENLTGFVSISETASPQYTFVPFELNKNTSSNQELWEKINQACKDVECNQLSSF